MHAHYEDVNASYCSLLLQDHPEEVNPVKQDEDTVTYSSFRAKIKTEADIDPSGLYSYITKSQLTKYGN
ncbi:hypothetical protein CHARACLAT_017685 [Characodon lateralis]|uniref:Uncharacterized protein n=1 Tax=Characodon lateralis TaxID=208331 RepID=A0ABU7ELN1_9TELE|nr:hypothetical protein [Characodon lateralis]